MSTRDEIRDAIERYAYARCSEEDGYTISPSIEPVMALIEPHLRIAEAAREWVVAVEDGGDPDWERGFAATDALLAAVDAEQVGGE